MTKPELTDADRARIADRYPRRNLVDTVIGTVSVLALVVAVGLVAWSGLLQSTPAVAGMVRAFDTISAEVTKVELVVQREDPALPATCLLFAQAENYERVGEVQVDVPAGEEKLTVVELEIKTIREATAVDLDGCRLVE